MAGDGAFVAAGSVDGDLSRPLAELGDQGLHGVRVGGEAGG
jgi:hypothetical protein